MAGEGFQTSQDTARLPIPCKVSCVAAQAVIISSLYWFERVSPRSLPLNCSSKFFAGFRGPSAENVLRARQKTGFPIGFRVEAEWETEGRSLCIDHGNHHLRTIISARHAEIA